MNLLMLRVFLSYTFDSSFSDDHLEFTVEMFIERGIELAILEFEFFFILLSIHFEIGLVNLLLHFSSLQDIRYQTYSSTQ